MKITKWETRKKGEEGEKKYEKQAFQLDAKATEKSKKMCRVQLSGSVDPELKLTEVAASPSGPTVLQQCKHSSPIIKGMCESQLTMLFLLSLSIIISAATQHPARAPEIHCVHTVLCLDQPGSHAVHLGAYHKAYRAAQ